MIARNLGLWMAFALLGALSTVQAQEQEPEQEQQSLSNVEIESTYEGAGTIVTTFRDNKASYRFISGQIKGAAAADLDYSSTRVRENAYFVRYHDPVSSNYFSLVIDMENMTEYLSSVMFYRSENSFTNFLSGKIDEVRWLD